MGERFLARPRAAVVCLALVFGSPALASATDCANVDPTPHLDAAYAVGWGIDHRNTRYQPRSSIDSSNAATLSVAWVYGLADTAPRSYPLVTEDTIFIGDTGRGVVALDRLTGCERWLYAHEGTIGSAIVQGRIDDRNVLVFNDRTKGVFVVDAVTGEFIWHRSVDDEPVPWYSATPLVTKDAVYVPVSSLEVGLAANPLYGCCTTSGGIAAFDIRTGKKLWYLPTIEAQARLTGSHFWFVQNYGPSGAAVWGAPAYDAERNWLFFGTGQNYSHPTTDTSDAIFAVDARTGKVV